MRCAALPRLRNCDNDSHLQWQAICFRLLARVQDGCVPTALVAGHHCRAGAFRHGTDRRADVLRERDRAPGQPGHRAAGRAACRRAGATARGCAGAPARPGAGAGHHPHADRPDRWAPVHGASGRQARRPCVFRSLHRRARGRATAERGIRLYRRPAPASTAGERGQAITGASTLVLLFFCASGLYLRWPRRWWSLRTWWAVEWRRQGRSFLWSLHAVFGTWCLLVYLLIALTGLTWSYTWYRDGMVALLGTEPAMRGDGRGHRPPRWISLVCSAPSTGSREPAARRWICAFPPAPVSR